MPELTRPPGRLPPGRRGVLAGRPALVIGPLVVAAVLGAAGGLLWELLTPVVTLPRTTGGLELDETSGARLFSFDGWFSVIAIVGGCVLGAAVLPLARRHGWRVVPVAAVAAVGAGLLQWWIGEALRPGGNSATAAVGSQVAVPLTLAGHVLVALWPLAAAVVLAVVSVLAPGLFDGRGDPEGTDPGANGSGISPDR